MTATETVEKKQRKDRFKKKEWKAVETALTLVIDGPLGADELTDEELAIFKSAQEKVRLRMAEEQDGE